MQKNISKFLEKYGFIQSNDLYSLYSDNYSVRIEKIGNKFAVIINNHNPVIIEDFNKLKVYLESNEKLVKLKINISKIKKILKTLPLPDALLQLNFLGEKFLSKNYSRKYKILYSYVYKNEKGTIIELFSNRTASISFPDKSKYYKRLSFSKAKLIILDNISRLLI